MSSMQSIKIYSQKLFHSSFYRTPYAKTTAFIKRKPMTAFFVALLALFILIIMGSLINRPQAEKPQEALTKSVHTYNIGETPKADFQAKINKAGVIKIV